MLLLRADRQPEFTQVDLEISFATEDLVFATLEPLMERLMALIGKDAPRPFLRLPYAEAIAKYGSDKPDLRCGMAIADLSAAFAGSEFTLFRDAIAAANSGVPTVAVATKNFEEFAHELAARGGRSGLRVHVLPYPLNELSREEVEPVAEAYFDGLLGVMGASLTAREQAA